MPERTAEEAALRQFLYTSNEQFSYIAGNPENYDYYKPENLNSIHKFFNLETPEKIISVIKEVDQENVTPRRENLLFALAVSILNNPTQSKTIKHDLYVTILQVIKNDKELFLFVKFLSKLNKTFSSGINKVIGGYYASKDPLRLAKDVSKCNSYHGWTHKDLIKLAHCKSENILVKIVFTYILFGFAKCQEIQTDSKASKDLMKYLTKVEAFKKAFDETTAASLLKELKMPPTKIPPKFHKSPLVWTAAVNNMPLQEIIYSLTKFYKLGLLRQDSAINTKIVHLLTNVDTIKCSKISPIDVFIGMKNFEKGGKPKDPKLKCFISQAAGKVVEDTPNEAPKCPQLLSSLHKSLQQSFHNLKSMDKRFLIIIDASTKMNEKCLHNKNITCYEAAAFLVVSLIRSEKNVIVCCFSEKNIVQIQVEKNISIGTLIKKFKEHENDERHYSSIFNWAINKKKQVDVFYFLNYFTTNFSKGGKQKHLIHSLQKYKSSMGIQAKVIRHSLCIYIPTPDEHSNNSLQICGFDAGVLRILEAYSKGLF